MHGNGTKSVIANKKGRKAPLFVKWSAMKNTIEVGLFFVLIQNQGR
ncbi:hypothetical protein Pse7429DRAFT_3254 [Pseudanabaena biceps PCC 7429]|uniref:Uncharacterized protein n=1 Tax=Pseudanabaena biceps PCC 7429 TaxID=927668 RepID=L8N0P6_9CYAN|nr:hypothetical protein Pse7429DRAFT_3254 [Pseudanabaena biceps PCC 7429]